MAVVQPIVSVILTTFNQERWLKEAIESVLSQTFQDWELLVVDNGSTDESPRIVASYVSDSRVRSVRYEQNTAHTFISNAAVQQARGRYISFLYGDDYYLPGKLARQVAAFDTLTPGHGVVYCGGYRLTIGGRLLDAPCAAAAGDILEPMLTTAPVQLFLPIAPLVRRDCLLRYPFNERLFIEGEAVFGKIALGYHFAPVSELLVVMRDHETNRGKEISANLERNVLMLEELFDHHDFPDRLQHHRAALMAKTFRLAGWQAIRRERNYEVGSERLRTAVAHDPSMRADPRVRAGLMLSRMPAWLANVCQSVIEGWTGAPPPVEGVDRLPVSGDRTVESARRSGAS